MPSARHPALAVARGGAKVCCGAAPPKELFTPWGRAQRAADRLAREAPPAPSLLRATGFLDLKLAERIVDWYVGPRTAPAVAVRTGYEALERETARLFAATHRLGVHVQYVYTDDPYTDAAELCADLRRHGSMALRTVACDAPHPVLDSSEGGVVDRLRAVHDVFGHAALGLGFVQSEFATWLQCRALLSAAARPAAFCELVGAVAAYVLTGDKPRLRADLPPLELLAVCDRTA
jgi:hypothetical protein